MHLHKCKFGAMITYIIARLQKGERMYHVNVIELKKAMIDAGLDSIALLSAATNINRNPLSDILHERSYPSSDVMIRLAKALCLTSEQCGSIFFAQELTEMQANAN